MADQDQAVDSDYSGRPYRRPSTEEILQTPPLPDSPYDRGAELPDGRRAVCGGRGQYYIAKDDGTPDWNQPVHVPGLSREPAKDEDSAGPA